MQIDVAQIHGVPTNHPHSADPQEKTRMLKSQASLQRPFSRMRSRRVPVLKLGSRGPGGDARSLRLCPQSVRNRSQSFAIIRNRPQASAIVRGGSHMPERRKSSRNAELSSLFTFCITKVSTVTGIGGVVVAKRRTVVTFGLVSLRRVSKVSTVTGIGGVVVAKPRTVVTFGLVAGERKGQRREEKR